MWGQGGEPILQAELSQSRELISPTQCCLPASCMASMHWADDPAGQNWGSNTPWGQAWLLRRYPEH